MLALPEVSSSIPIGAIPISKIPHKEIITNKNPTRNSVGRHVKK